MSFIRKVKVGKHTYLREVESVRKGNKIIQKYIKHIGKEVNGEVVRPTSTNSIRIREVKRSIDILCIDSMANLLKLKELIRDKTILAMAYSQILGKKSINKLEEWMKHTEIPDILDVNLTTKKMYSSLAEFTDENFTDIEDAIFSYLKKYEKSNKSAIIDVTDVYFEGNGRKEKPRRGKDGKVRKLIQIGLAVTLDYGFPIFHNIYHGNLSNMMIFRDMLMRIRRFEFDPIIMDRGMLSSENLKAIRLMDVPVIAGLKKSKTLEEDYIAAIERDDIYTLKHRVRLKNTSVFIKSCSYSKGKLIVVYNPDMEVLKKNKNFEKGIESKPSIGYSLIYHNTKLPDDEVARKYYEKDTIERAFKEIKGALNVRPIRVWLSNHTESHIRICYLAYAIMSLMNYKLRTLKMSAVDALNSLEHGYKVSLKDEKTQFEWELTVPLEPDQQEILKKLGVGTKIVVTKT